MNRNDWTRSFLARGTFPIGPLDPGSGIPINVLGGVTWINSEGSNAANNPLDTEQAWPGATNYNSVGVKNYATTVDGFNATLATLLNGYYIELVSQLRNPTTAEALITTIANSPWGSKPNFSMLDSIRNNWASYANIHVAGTGSNGPPTPEPTEETMLMDRTPSGNGYWECKPGDGSVYAYGDALYFGGLNYTNAKNVMVPGDVVTAFTAHPTSQGYWILTSGGRMYAYGAAKDFGSVD